MQKLAKYSYYLVFLLLLFIFKSPINYTFKNINNVFSKENTSEIKLLKKENKVLRNKLKKLDISDYDQFNYTKSKVIERNIYNFYDYIILDKGKKDNIKLNMAVVYDNNLVGIIKKVNNFNLKSYKTVNFEIN